MKNTFFRALIIIITCSFCLGALSSLTPWTNQFTKGIFIPGGIAAMIFFIYKGINDHGIASVLIALGWLALCINAVAFPTLGNILIAGGFTLIVIITSFVTRGYNAKRKKLIAEGRIIE